MLKAVAVVAAGLLTPWHDAASNRSPAADRPYQGIDLMVPHAPRPVRIDGRAMLFYELHVTNFANAPIQLRAIAVVDVAGLTIATLDPAAVARQLGARGNSNGTRLAPGQRSIIYVTIASSRGATSLRHRLEYEVETVAGSERVGVTGGDTRIDERAAPTLGAPLRGGPWTAVYAPDMDFGHRRYVYAVRGRAAVPGRMAIDWMPAAGFEPGSAGTSVSAKGEGADVLAVADATVVAVKRSLPIKAPATIEDETGAMVVLALGDGQFAFYEHLAPEPLVAVGQTVVRGQVIAKLGATGHVSQPHLHFHVADGMAPLSSEGLPYRLAAGRVIGRYASIAAFGAGTPWQQSTPHRVDDFPAANAVVMFD